jgi:hypothetical protein
MNLGEFKVELKAEIKRGDSYDLRLDGLTRRAARWIEQNYTFQYMRRRFEVDSVEAEATIDLPANVPIKAIEYLRFDGTDGTRYEVSKGDLSDDEWKSPVDRYGENWRVNLNMPTLFYLDGADSLVFNRVFPAALVGQGIMARYTDFPRENNQTHWLLQNAEGLLLRQALLEFMVSERDDRGFQAVAAKRQEDIKALIDADFHTRWTGQDVQL